MRTYEVIFITAPNLSKEELEAYIDQAVKVVETKGGTIVKLDRWGKRNLAYKIEKFKEGYYVFMTIRGDSGIVSELERRFRVTDFVLRFLTIFIDRDLKRLEKTKSKRAKKAKHVPLPATQNVASELSEAET